MAAFASIRLSGRQIRKIPKNRPRFKRRRRFAIPHAAETAASLETPDFFGLVSAGAIPLDFARRGAT
jgi:hypothetical protein